MHELIATEVLGDVLFLTEKDENTWWYDGEYVRFRTPSYAAILREMQENPKCTLASLKASVGINRSAIQKMISSLVKKGYIEKDDNGSWRVFIMPSM